MKIDIAGFIFKKLHGIHIGKSNKYLTDKGVREVMEICLCVGLMAGIIITGIGVSLILWV